ncbi:MAG: hypothetical protein J2P16_01150 [Mycobacterium sp.]|nr:hypothetical protein [Mycobacterium sp.]
MPLSRRYSPEKPPAEVTRFGMDFSPVLPPGVGITSGTVELWTNTPGDIAPTTELTAEPVKILGRAVYAQLSGGIEGTDYQVRWKITDTAGNTWQRTALVLCAQTS